MSDFRHSQQQPPYQANYPPQYNALGPGPYGGQPYASPGHSPQPPSSPQPPPSPYQHPAPSPYNQPSPYGLPPSQFHQQPYAQGLTPPPGQPVPYGQSSPYGQPSPYGQQVPFGQPPSSPYLVFPPTPPSLGYGPLQPIQWDASPDAQELRRAMKGLGTDEAKLIRVLGTKDPLQVAAINEAYRTVVKRDLIADIKSELSGSLLWGMLCLARGPLMADVYLVREAIQGPGTNETLLDEILLSRSNADMNAIKAAYGREFGKDMISEVRSDLKTLGMSSKTERVYDMVMAARRAEDAEPIDPGRVAADVDVLYAATEAKLGTDELRVGDIFANRNDNQLRAISWEYQQKYRRSLVEVIKSEFSGHLRDILLFQIQHAEDKYMHAAMRIDETVRGWGTKDKLLMTRIVRLHWNADDLRNIKGAYQSKMGVGLAQRIRQDTSGDSARLLLTCIGEN